ncbi:MAG TPA: rhomboid family intramembrane serine protease [Enhygromyxa sp.]|nr:rhomboid family intramembrane serine protease [Enhygromyxa sp.]
MSQRKSESRGLTAELKSIVKTLAVCLGLLWALELTDVLLLDGMLDGFGIRPRELFGLIGVLTWPFLHGGLPHLVSNTIAMLLFGTLVLMWGRREFFTVAAVSTIVGGLGVWLVGADGSVHVGASGVCFGLFGYLLARGFYERKFGSVVLSLVIAISFGGTLAGAVPGLSMPGISWEGHLFGLVGGVLVARRLKKKRAE